MKFQLSFVNSGIQERSEGARRTGGKKRVERGGHRPLRRHRGLHQLVGEGRLSVEKEGRAVSEEERGS